GTDEKVVIKHQIDVATLNLIYKAVKDNSDDSGWAYLGTVGTYISTVKPDFDTRNYGYAKLSGLIQALDLFETKMQGSQMYLRKRSFSTFVKFVQKAIAQHADIHGWAKISSLVKILETSDFNIRNYEEAIKSIHSGWIVFSEKNDKVKVARLMP
ncbi:MAG: OST-HTH/LOTUS domain-containing protein, partial [Pseudomonadota bacterium]|nr:OST-HTH/LOTUS domain-containing protein [Pseudomonadota bacterium]